MTTLTLTCRCCGYDFAFPEDAAIFDCPACGTHHARPKTHGAEPDVLKRAHQLRAACDFTQAEKDYRRILAEHPNEHEALWGLVLCSYGVEYVETSRGDGSKTRTPVIHFLRRKPLMEDANYRLACAAAPEEVRALYEADAQYIDGIRRGVLAKEAQAEDCDIFLCYKATGADGQGQAAEYVHAMELYMELEKQGYRVFFAHQSLTKAIGANYEAQIYHALHRAKVMLLVCADPANLNTPWVRSEWSRFLERVDAGEQCKLIPLLYDGCDPYALPGEMIARGLQGLRMDEITSLDTLREKLKEACGKTHKGTGTGIPLVKTHFAKKDKPEPKKHEKREKRIATKKRVSSSVATPPAVEAETVETTSKKRLSPAMRAALSTLGWLMLFRLIEGGVFIVGYEYMSFVPYHTVVLWGLEFVISISMLCLSLNPKYTIWATPIACAFGGTVWDVFVAPLRIFCFVKINVGNDDSQRTHAACRLCTVSLFISSFVGLLLSFF